MMIRIITKLYDGSTYSKTVDIGGTPVCIIWRYYVPRTAKVKLNPLADSGINCLVDDVVCSTFMRCEVKEVNWRFV